ncbi:hypothetical protein BGX21_006250 [Mortierella sp. AD011]|nr:hypothetical protein BGX20_002224 [Mortierella sp. AD010]KAF9368965.1 hypothetical protein BGX21_006250 [Mortierella sp. AD011]
MPQRLSDIDWFESDSNTNESAEAFFDALGVSNNKQSTYNRYIRAVNDSKLDELTKNTLQAAFNKWKETKAADVYWVRYQSERSVVKVAATLVEGAVPFAENFIRGTACRAVQLQSNNPEEREESEAVE